MRAGIKAILEQSQEFTVIGEAADGSEAVAECKQKHPDMIAMDIGLAGMNGIETMQADGKSSKDIAGILGLEPATVRTYRKTMMGKLGINNVAGCVWQVHLAHFDNLVAAQLSH